MRRVEAATRRTRTLCVLGCELAVPMRPDDAPEHAWIAEAAAEEVSSALEAISRLPGRHRLETLEGLYARTLSYEK